MYLTFEKMIDIRRLFPKPAQMQPVTRLPLTLPWFPETASHDSLDTNGNVTRPIITHDISTQFTRTPQARCTQAQIQRS